IHAAGNAALWPLGRCGLGLEIQGPQYAELCGVDLSLSEEFSFLHYDDSFGPLVSLHNYVKYYFTMIFPFLLHILSGIFVTFFPSSIFSFLRVLSFINFCFLYVYMFALRSCS
ncbi:hypothetical protein L9F63_009303, partial [Diploptera punctata]